MLIEFLQFCKMIVEGTFYYLPLHLILIVLLPLLVRRILARKYSPSHSLENNVKASVVIPEHKEDLTVFEKCLKSVADNKPDEILVVHDDGRTEVRNLAQKYGAETYSFSHRVGKRTALVHGWYKAASDIIIHVDSDVILHENALKEIVKPFDDNAVMGVQGKNQVNSQGSWFSWRMSQLLELNRDLSNKALNNHLVVVDGRFNAWRRKFLTTNADAFLKEHFLGKLCEIGDDRFLTAQANLGGYKTVYQETAVAETSSPSTYIKFLKQQLRWLRSGYKAFFKDFATGVPRKVSLFYTFAQICYYMGSISFTAAIIHDLLYAPPILTLPLPTLIPIAIIGSGIIATIRRFAVKFYPLTLKEFFLLGATSIFIAYPLALYALATIRRQSVWGTR